LSAPYAINQSSSALCLNSHDALALAACQRTRRHSKIARSAKSILRASNGYAIDSKEPAGVGMHLEFLVVDASKR